MPRPPPPSWPPSSGWWRRVGRSRAISAARRRPARWEGRSPACSEAIRRRVAVCGAGPGCGPGAPRCSLSRPERRRFRAGTCCPGGSTLSQRAVFKARRVANESVSAWLPDHAVVVDGERIADVVPGASLPGDVTSGPRVYDLGDVSLLPGLIDCHSHLHCSATPDAYQLVTTESIDRLLLRAAANARIVLMS